MKLESFLLAAFIACLASLLQAQTKSLEVLVVDAKDQPVFNADIEVREWTGRFAPTDFRRIECIREKMLLQNSPKKP